MMNHLFSSEDTIVISLALNLIQDTINVYNNNATSTYVHNRVEKLAPRTYKKKSTGNYCEHELMKIVGMCWREVRCRRILYLETFAALIANVGRIVRCVREGRCMW